MTTSRKPTEANSVNMAKLPAPTVARPTSALWLPLLVEEFDDPISKANAMISGSTRMTSPMIWVRRRRSWRVVSTRRDSVRRGR